MLNPHRGETDLAGVGVLRYTWDGIARLKSELGDNFDERISDATVRIDVDVLAVAVAVGSGKTPGEVMAISPAIVPTSRAVIAALNLAFHGTEGAPRASAAANPTKAKSLAIWFAKLFKTP